MRNCQSLFILGKSRGLLADLFQTVLQTTVKTHVIDFRLNTFLPSPRPGCLTVNIGDALTRWTDGTFKSTYHRVRTPKETDPLVRTSTDASFLFNYY